MIINLFLSSSVVFSRRPGILVLVNETDWELLVRDKFLLNNLPSKINFNFFFAG